jgi:hypothetical protein
MKRRGKKVRRTAILATGIVMATSFGLAGAGAASAASPALHIKNGSEWNVEPFGEGCEIATFSSNGTFITTDTGNGTWSGGAASVSMKWTSGVDSGLRFKGMYVSSSKEYSGKIKGPTGGGAMALLVKESSC